MTIHKKPSDTLRALVAILNDLQSHSGTALGEQLKITRHAVWKIIQQLQGYQVPLEIHKAKGYRLAKPLYLLTEEAIKKEVKTAIVDESIDILESTPSTQRYLHEKTTVNICLAEQQTQGRGRRGHYWHSPFGENIYLSYRYCFDHDAGQLAGFSLVSSLAILAALKQYGIKDQLAVKWPNDIFFVDSKLAGCLIDINAEANGLTEVMIGIGINVNMDEANNIKRSWSALKTITQTEHDRNKLVGLLLDNLYLYIQRFIKNGFNDFLAEWEKYDYLKGKEITLDLAQKKISGVYQGITAQGYLKLQLGRGEVRTFSAGEVSIGL